MVAKRSGYNVEKNQEGQVRRNDAPDSACVKRLERGCLPAKIQQHRCNQKSRKDKEEINANPSVLGKTLELPRKHFIVAANDQQDGDSPQAVKFRDSLQSAAIISPAT